MFVRSLVWLLLVLGMSLGMVDAKAGIQIELQVLSAETNSSEKQVKKLELNVQDGVVWISNTLFDTYIVFDSIDRTLAVVDHRRKQYVVATESEIDDEIDEARRFAAMITGADPSDIVNNKLQPEDFEKEFESKSMDEIDQILLQQGVTTKTTPTGLNRVFSDGYADMPCEVYAVAIDEGASQLQQNQQKNLNHRNHICIADVENFEIPQEDWQTLQDFLKLAWRYMGRHPLATVLGVALPKVGDEIIDGIPIHIEDPSSDSPPLMQAMLIQSADITHAQLIPAEYQLVNFENECISGCKAENSNTDSTAQTTKSQVTSTSDSGKSETVRKKRRLLVTRKKQRATPASQEIRPKVQTRKKRKLIASSNNSKTSLTQPDEALDSACRFCPTMVVVPAGKFLMGAPLRVASEATDMVTIEQFELGAYEITREQYAVFVDETQHEGGSDCTNDAVLDFMREEMLKGNYDPDISHVGGNWLQPGFEQNENHPVACVSWNDAQAYVSWLSKKTGKQYRLPSESEWEYAARAGTDTAYFWGDEIGQGNAICASDCGDEFNSTAPVGSLPANTFGLHDMHGNVYEWVHDDWLDDIKGAPKNGTASVTNAEAKVIRGGGFESKAKQLESTFRWRIGSASARSNGTGFRVARTLSQ